MSTPNPPSNLRAALRKPRVSRGVTEGHSPPRSCELLLEPMSSGPEAERAVEVSTVEDDRLGHTLVLLLSRRDIPDTSRKPGEESSSVLCSHKTPTIGNLGACLPLPCS